MLTPEFAEWIVAETMQRVNRNINIFDASGKVLASGDKSRIGQFHKAAYEAIQQKKTYSVGQEITKQWKGVQAGINMPIEYRGAVVGAVGISGDPEEVISFVQLVKMAVELMLQQEQDRLEKDWKQLIVNRISDDLLSEGTKSADMFNRRLQPIPFALRPPYQVAIIALPSSPANDEIDPYFFHELKTRFLLTALVSLHHSGHYVLIFSGQSSKKIKQLLEGFPWPAAEENRLAIGVGTQVTALDQLPDSYRESQTALDWNKSIGGRVSYYEDLSWKAIIREITPGSRRRITDQFAADLTPKIRETLSVYLDCDLNVAASSKQLGIHRNTMLYRLEQIHSETGCNPQIFHDALKLQLAMWIIPSNE
ncbi:CdaR family transcriptional regulator [Cohnella terricola]|uniref:Carbohydrate diacid regulator n=1 Tax=Cohnella terricola TaxID=1289167 RepID=A0A559JEK7_9BACL|nr:sugar diacid recognition domain-containing protein [Cohnella terricola]TVX98324.1 hypothetical protein FPZ45_16660 [Cohnella terricola]